MVTSVFNNRVLLVTVVFSLIAGACGGAATNPTAAEPVAVSTTAPVVDTPRPTLAPTVDVTGGEPSDVSEPVSAETSVDREVVGDDETGLAVEDDGEARDQDADSGALAPTSVPTATQAVEPTPSSEAQAPAVLVPELTGEYLTISGAQIDLGSLQGQDVVLWFWAPW